MKYFRLILLCIIRMASHGRTIIMSIHQPRYSIYRLFDGLTLLVGGRMVYHGQAPNALDYFANLGDHELKESPNVFIDVLLFQIDFVGCVLMFQAIRVSLTTTQLTSFWML